MNIPTQNRRNRLPLWQSEKMRSMIESRWEEVWEVVVNRDGSPYGEPPYLESPQKIAQHVGGDG